MAATKSPAKKKTTKTRARKRVAKGSTVKGTANSKGSTKAEPTERQKAKEAGLSLPQARVLKALANSKTPMSYKDIEAATGYYSNLTAVLRTDHDGSLAEKKLVKEEQHDIDGKDTLVFSALAAGKKLAAKL